MNIGKSPTCFGLEDFTFVSLSLASSLKSLFKDLKRVFRASIDQWKFLYLSIISRI